VKALWRARRRFSIAETRGARNVLRIGVASAGCGLLAAAGLRCDFYEVPAELPRTPAVARESAPRTPVVANPKPGASEGPRAAGGESTGGGAMRDAGRALSIPSEAPPYLPATYRASLECPQPRTTRLAGAPAVLPQLEETPDPDGKLASFQPGGPTNTADQAFFQALGTNGRACVSCHEPESGMSVSVERIQLRFERTLGADPIFAPVDGANCPNAVQPADTSSALVGGRIGHGSAEARASHSLLLTKGLVRIFLPVPEDADYTVTVARDPYHCNTDPDFNRATDPRTGVAHQVLSVYRRPRPATNLKAITTGGVTIDAATGQPVVDGSNVMWDGREPNLETQAVDATLVHAQALHAPSRAQVEQIVAFQRGIFTAQIFSNPAHRLTDLGALGGPELLASMTTVAPSDGGAGAQPLSVFDAWRNLAPDVEQRDERQSVFRGQAIFQNRAFPVDNVAGLNDTAGFDRPIPNATCATCHSQPSIGGSTFAGAQLDIGIGGADASFGGPAPADDLPIFQFVCHSGAPTGFHGQSILTNDPGKALVTGRCADIGRFTVPPLRGLDGRAPYFSDGSAPELIDVVEFYDKRFAIGLSARDKDDLVHFLRAL
jgi:hypothetical protein